jgi:formate hydrogenlyase subunit 6/NADH:ubiquinone oxidoreductase subunit I
MADAAVDVSIRIEHDACTGCRMCYVVCRDLDLNAVAVMAEARHRLEIDVTRCLYPRCTVCLMYCPAPGSIVEVQSGRSLVPPPPAVWTEDRRRPRTGS